MTHGKEPWYRSILTDHNGDFDMGAVLVGVVAIFMCVNSAIDTWHGTKFDPQSFGIGIAAMLGGFAAYKWGDAKRPDVSTTVETKTRTTVGPPQPQMFTPSGEVDDPDAQPSR